MMYIANNTLISLCIKLRITWEATTEAEVTYTKNRMLVIFY